MMKAEGDGEERDSWTLGAILRRIEQLEREMRAGPPVSRDLAPSWHESHLKEMALATDQDRDVLAEIYRRGPASPVGRPVVAPLVQGGLDATELRPAVCVAVLMAHQLVTVEGVRAPGVLPAVLNAECKRLGVATDHRVIADLRKWQRRLKGLIVPEPLEPGDRVLLILLEDGQLSLGSKATCLHAIEVVRRAVALRRLNSAGRREGLRTLSRQDPGR